VFGEYFIETLRNRFNQQPSPIETFLKVKCVGKIFPVIPSSLDEKSPFLNIEFGMEKSRKYSR